MSLHSMQNIVGIEYLVSRVRKKVKVQKSELDNPFKKKEATVFNF